MAHFLHLLGEAHRCASDDQRMLIRQLAMMQLSTEENVEYLGKIMGWWP